MCEKEEGSTHIATHDTYTLEGVFHIQKTGPSNILIPQELSWQPFSVS